MIKVTSLVEITELEAVFLTLIDFDFIVRVANYAKHYFVLQTLGQKFKYALLGGPLTVHQIQKLYNACQRQELKLKKSYGIAKTF